MYISNFTYHKPLSLVEACKILEQSENGAPIAGGTDILVEIKNGLRHNDDIVSLSEIEELKVLDVDSDYLFIGAGITHNELKISPIINRDFPSVCEAASMIGTEQIRNTATVGGNLCTGASCCDMAPVLIALNSEVEIANSRGKRKLSLKDFFIIHKDTSLKKGEIMTKIIVPLANQNVGVAFEKFGLREAASISVASASAMIKVEDGKCADSCVVIGAVAPTPKISKIASDILTGIKINELVQNSPALTKAGKGAASEALPLDDIRGTADYRRNIVNVLAQRAISRAAARANNSTNQ
jgi:carbon-monoxide dehydrogenase medium subunit